MDYEVTQLNDRLFFIRWNRSPEQGDQSETAFVAHLQTLLDQSREPIFFISDLRLGRISNALVLRQLGKLTGHKRWGGSTAFSSDPVTELMTNVFKQYARRTSALDNNQTWDTPEEAISYLESVEPGLTENINWETIIHAAD